MNYSLYRILVWIGELLLLTPGLTRCFALRGWGVDPRPVGDCSVAEMDRAVYELDRVEVVGDEQAGDAALVAYVPQQTEDLPASGRVEVSGWLVGEQQVRLGRKGLWMATRWRWPIES